MMKKKSNPWSYERYRASAIPTMVAAEELSYLHWLGRTMWDGRTDVVEFGPWLGGTTTALATGMKRNPRRNPAAKLHTIDNFVWHRFMSERAPVSLPTGASFRSLLERNISDHLDLVVVHEARLPDDGLGDIEFEEPIRDRGSGVPLFSSALVEGPIQVVFVDGAKSWHAFQHMLCELQLTPYALLVLQDFQNWASYWVPMMISLLREDGQRLKLVHVLASDTISVELPDGVDMSRVPVMPEEISVERGSQLMRSAVDWIAPVAPAAARKIALAEVVWLGSNGNWADARALVSKLAASWRLRDRVGPLEQTILWVERNSGSPVSRGRRIAAQKAAEGAKARVRRLLRRVNAARASVWQRYGHVGKQGST